MNRSESEKSSEINYPLSPGTVRVVVSMFAVSNGPQLSAQNISQSSQSHVDGYSGGNSRSQRRRQRRRLEREHELNLMERIFDGVPGMESNLSPMTTVPTSTTASTLKANVHAEMNAANMYEGKYRSTNEALEYFIEEVHHRENLLPDFSSDFVDTANNRNKRGLYALVHVLGARFAEGDLVECFRNSEAPIASPSGSHPQQFHLKSA